MKLGNITTSVGFVGFEVSAIIGIYPHERENAQLVTIDLELFTDFSLPASTESINHAVDYTNIARDLKALLQSKQYHLVETFIVDGLQRIFDQWPMVERAKLIIRKTVPLPEAASCFAQGEATRCVNLNLAGSTTT